MCMSGMLRGPFLARMTWKGFVDVVFALMSGHMTAVSV